MNKQWNQTGRRYFLSRRPPWGALPRITIILYSLLILAAAGLIASCGKDEPFLYDNEQVAVQSDSCSFKVVFNVQDNLADTLRRPGRLDLFVYAADGIKELLDVRTYDFMPDSVLLYGTDADRLVVAIANSTMSFNTDALSRYDSIELLTWNFFQDSPSAPVMSGQCELAADTKATLTLTPLMARVQLGEISNSMKGYVRLENPRLYLENMNGSAELMRTVGFRPTEAVSNPPRTPLPYDIGIFPQNPGTEVFCYPNDTPGTIGTPETAIVLECEIYGTTHCFRTPIPSIGRNSTTRLDISVSGPDSFESRIY